MCVCLQGGAVASHKRGKTATPNLRQIAHNPRTTARFDSPFYTPIRRLQILGPDSDPPKTETRPGVSPMGFSFLYLIPFTDKVVTER